MSNCCSGNCDHCGGCAGQLVLSQPELDLLAKLAENAFLPVARRMDDPAPVYREDHTETQERYSLILQCLEKKGLIEIDFTAPLKGADMSAYSDCPIHGSFALTARGQEVLDVLDKQGIEEI